jgi:hypothetical protein
LVLLVACIFSATLCGSPHRLLPQVAGVAVAKLQKIEAKDGQTIITLNFVASVSGDTPAGLADFALDQSIVADVDNRVVGMTALVFLSRPGDGKWHLAVDQSSRQLLNFTFLPLSDALPFESWVPDQRIALKAELVRFLLWVISRKPESGGSFGLLLELLQGDPIESDVVQEELYALSNSPDLRLSTRALAALIHARDPRGLERLVVAVSNRETAFLDDGLVSYSIRKLDPRKTELAGVLKQLLNCESIGFRRAVTRQLARMHSKDSVETLARLLEDPDPEIAASAVGGLAMFANGVPPGGFEPGPGPAPFRTDQTIAHSATSADAVLARPSFYLDFWKAWWAENAAKVVER